MDNTLFAFFLFSVVASITPGPTNILILSNSYQFGLTKSWALILGASIAAAIIVLVMGIGLGSLLKDYPLIKLIMAWGGALWLTVVSWQLWSIDNDITKDDIKLCAGWKTGALLQIVNPKTWIMALAVSGIFITGDATTIRVTVLSLIFMLTAIPCLACWGLLGIGTHRLLTKPQHQRNFNRFLALILLISVWWAVLVGG